jgi:hypothetical protein
MEDREYAEGSALIEALDSTASGSRNILHVDGMRLV